MYNSGSLLTAEWVAERLAVSERTVIRLVERRELGAIKVGNQWRFDPSDVEDYIMRHRVDELGAIIKSACKWAEVNGISVNGRVYSGGENGYNPHRKAWFIGTLDELFAVHEDDGGFRSPTEEEVEAWDKGMPLYQSAL